MGTRDNDPLDQDELGALEKLPVLDSVVRETLRLHSPASNTVRSAVKDDMLPLSKPFVDVNGEVRDAVPVSKGNGVVIPIQLVNRSEELWGPDAKEFRFILLFSPFLCRLT
jgi:cytochrome P450